MLDWFFFRCLNWVWCCRLTPKNICATFWMNPLTVYTGGPCSRGSVCNTCNHEITSPFRAPSPSYVPTIPSDRGSWSSTSQFAQAKAILVFRPRGAEHQSGLLESHWRRYCRAAGCNLCWRAMEPLCFTFASLTGKKIMCTQKRD